MRTTLFGLPVDLLSHDETLERALDAMRSGKRCQHVALNVAKIVGARTDAELRRDICESDLVGIDGMGVILALRLLGQRPPERVAGIDLFQSLIAACAREGLRPYLLGAKPDVLERTERRLVEAHPGLVVAGRHHGYFGADDERICADVRASGADCLFIALPTPAKERFMARHRDRLGVPFIMGVGGSFDVVAGDVRRAPPAWQRLGLEWLYRLLQEPRRLGGRYVSTNAAFALMLLSAWTAARFARGRVAADTRAPRRTP